MMYKDSINVIQYIISINYKVSLTKTQKQRQLKQTTM